LRWQGNPEYDQDLHRSIPLKEIVDVLPKNMSLYSVQRDNGLEELEPFNYITDLSSKLETFNDLFACINNLDLIITSCTSVAHIAAAMGKEVIVIVPISCYYVWCQPSTITLWYGTNVTVLYQKTPRSWKEPLQELKLLLN
jgi:ADP-heptose:LPS heptosyltransferase